MSESCPCARTKTMLLPSGENRGVESSNDELPALEEAAAEGAREGDGLQGGKTPETRASTNANRRRLLIRALSRAADMVESGGGRTLGERVVTGGAPARRCRL